MWNVGRQNAQAGTAGDRGHLARPRVARGHANATGDTSRETTLTSDVN